MITIVKEKHNGEFKGRACANSKKQWLYIKKEDAAAPTVGLESLTLTLLIDTHEERDVATADVVGTYLKSLMENFVVVKFMGEEVDIMLNIDRARYAPYMDILGEQWPLEEI